MRRLARTFLSLLLVSGVSVCLTTGIASATKASGNGGDHSCCPSTTDSQSDAGADKTSAGAPNCCLTMAAQGKIAHAVFSSLGFHECGAASAGRTPLLRSIQAAIPAPDVLRTLLTKAVLSIRAPPQA